MERGSKSVWYKRAQHNVKNKTLQALLADGLSKLHDPFGRLWAPNGDAGDKFAINDFSSYQGTLVGQFVCFQPGQRQAVITLAPGTQAFDISSIPPGPGGREFIEGLCYFLVFQNHVLFAKSKALGSREFERYLGWILAEATSVIAKDAVVSIVDQPSTETLRKVANKKLRGITFGTPLKPVATPEIVNGQSVLVYDATGSSWDGLRALLGASVFDKVKMTSALDEAQLEVQVTVRVRGLRAVPDDAHKMLGELAKAARHVDPEDIELEVQGVGSIKGDELKVHKSMSVHWLESGGLVDQSELWQKMLEWLKQMIDEGTISV